MPETPTFRRTAYIVYDPQSPDRPVMEAALRGLREVAQAGQAEDQEVVER